MSITTTEAVPKFKVGDHIEYFAGTYDHAKVRVGMTGTITRVIAGSSEPYYQIKWDDGYDALGSYRQANIRLLRAKPTQAEIDDALTLLRGAGEVTFKAFKPPFQPISVVGVPGYTTKITDTHVEVGCKTIPFSVIDEIAAAVAKARAYNADN